MLQVQEHGGKYLFRNSFFCSSLWEQHRQQRSMCPKIQISTTWGRWDGNQAVLTVIHFGIIFTSISTHQSRCYLSSSLFSTTRSHALRCPIKLSICAPNYRNLKTPSPQTLRPIFLEASASWALRNRVFEDLPNFPQLPQNFGHFGTPHTCACDHVALSQAWTRLLGFQQSAIEVPPPPKLSAWLTPLFQLKGKVGN